MYEQNTKYEFSKIFYLAFILLLILVVFVWFGIIRITIIPITEGDTGELMSTSEKLSFLIPTSIVGITWTISFLVLCYQRFIVKTPVSIDEEGIHNINIGGVLLAFIFVLPIKFINWNNLYLDGLTIKIKKEHIKELPIYTRLFVYIFVIKLFVGYSKLDEVFYKFLIKDEDN